MAKIRSLTPGANLGFLPLDQTSQASGPPPSWAVKEPRIDALVNSERRLRQSGAENVGQRGFISSLFVSGRKSFVCPIRISAILVVKSEIRVDSC